MKDFENDSRICLTSIHLPEEHFLSEIRKKIVEPLRKINPEHYYYSPESLHITIKNVRVINDPPHFTGKDVEKTKEVFSRVIPRHRKFNAYFYRLLLFPYNLVLMGTSDPESDDLIIDLDTALVEAGVPDDKKYINSEHFFLNMTLARFNSPPSAEFRRKVKELSQSLGLKSYGVDLVTLVTANAVMKNRTVRGAWKLKS